MASPLENVRDAIQGFKDYIARIEQAVDLKDWQHNLRRIELFGLTQHLTATFNDWQNWQSDEAYEDWQADHAYDKMKDDRATGDRP